MIQYRIVENSFNGVTADVKHDIIKHYKKGKAPGNAGLDLCYVGPDFKLQPNESVTVNTGLSVYLGDPSFAGFVYPRSGLGSRGIVLGNLVGVIDSSYQGEIKVSIWNRSTEVKYISSGQRVAQYVIKSGIVHPDLKWVESFDDTTERGEGGFGSTGDGHESAGVESGINTASSAESLSSLDDTLGEHGGYSVSPELQEEANRIVEKMRLDNNTFKPNAHVNEEGYFECKGNVTNIRYLMTWNGVNLGTVLLSTVKYDAEEDITRGRVHFNQTFSNYNIPRAGLNACVVV